MEIPEAASEAAYDRFWEAKTLRIDSEANMCLSLQAALPALREQWELDLLADDALSEALKSLEESPQARERAKLAIEGAIRVSRKTNAQG